VLVETSRVVTLREEHGFLTPVTKIFKQPHYEGDVPLEPATFVPGTSRLIRELLRRSTITNEDRKDIALGVPASFGVPGKKRLREAAKRGVYGDRDGYEGISLYCEPVAAARSYFAIDPGNILVLDYGGGTLDISVIPVTHGKAFSAPNIYFAG